MKSEYRIPTIGHFNAAAKDMSPAELTAFVMMSEAVRAANHQAATALTRAQNEIDAMMPVIGDEQQAAALALAARIKEQLKLF